MQMDVQFGTSQVCRRRSHDDAALSPSIVLNFVAGMVRGPLMEKGHRETHRGRETERDQGSSF